MGLLSELNEHISIYLYLLLRMGPGTEHMVCRGCYYPNYYHAPTQICSHPLGIQVSFFPFIQICSLPAGSGEGLLISSW